MKDERGWVRQIAVQNHSYAGEADEALKQQERESTRRRCRCCACTVDQKGGSAPPLPLCLIPSAPFLTPRVLCCSCSSSRAWRRTVRGWRSPTSTSDPHTPSRYVHIPASRGNIIIFSSCYTQYTIVLPLPVCISIHDFRHCSMKEIWTIDLISDHLFCLLSIPVSLLSDNPL
jgi:hypothetical protein